MKGVLSAIVTVLVLTLIYLATLVAIVAVAALFGWVAIEVLT